MITALETSVRILTQRIDATTAAPRTGILHAIASRSEAVRLAPVIAELRSAGFNQTVAYLPGAQAPALSALEEHGVPRTLLFEPQPAGMIQHTADVLTAAEETL